MSVGKDMANAGAEGAVARRSSVKIMIGLAAMVIVALFASANFMVLDYSIRQANDFVATSEKMLIKNEFRQQIEQVVLYQSGMSVWDRSFDELADGSFSDDFIRGELRDWLWSDFGFSWIVFTKPGEGTVLAVQNRHVVQPQDADKLLYWVSDLTKRAEAAYYAALRRTRDGWILAKPPESTGVLSPTLAQINVTGMRMIDGTMSIIVVQAVVPKRLFIPDAHKPPVLMVTVKPITAKMLANSEQRLGLRDLGFSPITTEDDDLLLTGVGGDAFNPMAGVLAAEPSRLLRMVDGDATDHRAGYDIRRRHGFRRAEVLLPRAGAGAKRIAQRLSRPPRCPDRAAEPFGLRRYGEILLTRPGEPFAVFAIDLDRFKAVNDRHGHAAGDAVLRTIARGFWAGSAAREWWRGSGGDEFAVLLPGRPTGDALRSCQRSGARRADPNSIRRTTAGCRQQRWHRCLPRARPDRARPHGGCRHGALYRQERWPQPRGVRRTRCRWTGDNGGLTDIGA